MLCMHHAYYNIQYPVAQNIYVLFYTLIHRAGVVGKLDLQEFNSRNSGQILRHFPNQDLADLLSIRLFLLFSGIKWNQYLVGKGQMASRLFYTKWGSL